MADSSEVLASLEDHRACDLAILDQKIETKDFTNVYTFLAKFSILWFRIGLYLGVPRDILLVIEYDNRQTPQRLAKMLDAWLNNCKNCTWRVLSEALQHVREKPKMVAWDEKAAVLSSREAGFTIMQSVTKKFFENYMIYLRGVLKVPYTISDESLLCNINLYLIRHFDGDFIFDTMTQSAKVSEIAKSFQYNKKCFQVWANFLKTETNSVCDKLSTLAKQKEEIKKTLFLQEAEKEKRCESNSFGSPYFSIASTDQAQDIKQDMEAADDYRESLCHCLNSCLDSVNVAINRNSNTKFAGTTMKTSINRLLFTSILIAWDIMCPLQELSPVIATVCFIFGLLILIFILDVDNSKWVRYIVAYVATIINRYYITAGTLAGVCVGFINFPLLGIPNSLQEQSEPNHQQARSIQSHQQARSIQSHQQAQSTLNNQLIMASVKAMQHNFNNPITFVSFILGAMLISAIWHHSNQTSKITGIVSFMMVLCFGESLSKIFLLAGMFWSIIYAMSGRFIKFILFLSAMGFLYCFTLPVVSCIGSRLFCAYGHHMQFIGAGIGDGIVALCTLIFVSSIKIPLIDDYMTESMECFNENIQDLKLIKKGTNDTLYKALTLKHQLTGT